MIATIIIRYHPLFDLNFATATMNIILNSLGVISFDPKVAVIRKTDNHWVKTYKIEGMNSDNRNEFIDELVKLFFKDLFFRSREHISVIHDSRKRRIIQP